MNFALVDNPQGRGITLMLLMVGSSIAGGCSDWLGADEEREIAGSGSDEAVAHRWAASRR